MQKLVTIYLDSMKYCEGKWIASGGNSEWHGSVEEHLRAEVDEGWRIAQLHGLGGAATSMSASGWLAVVLEK